MSLENSTSVGDVPSTVPGHRRKSQKVPTPKVFERRSRRTRIHLEKTKDPYRRILRSSDHVRVGSRDGGCGWDPDVESVETE